MAALALLELDVKIAATKRLRKHDHQAVQDILDLLLAACSSTQADVQLCLAEGVAASMQRPTMHNVFEQALASFLIIKPEFSGVVLRSIMAHLQHGPTNSKHSTHASQYSKQLVVVSPLLACFQRASKTVAHSAPVGGQQACFQLCVTLLREMISLYAEHQRLASEQAQAVIDKPGSRAPPIYIHPSSLVKFFIDCLLEVPCTRDRMDLLLCAMHHKAKLDIDLVAAPGTQGAAQGVKRTLEDTELDMRLAKRQHLHTASSTVDGQQEPPRSACSSGTGSQAISAAPTQPDMNVSVQPSSTQLAGAASNTEGVSTVCLLLAQACHDDMLRYGSPSLANDLLHLIISHSSFFSDQDILASSQILIKALLRLGEPELEQLIRSAAWNTWCDTQQQNTWCDTQQQLQQEETTLGVLRLLNLLSSDHLTHAFPTPGAHCTAQVTITSPSPISVHQASTVSAPPPSTGQTQTQEAARTVQSDHDDSDADEPPDHKEPEDAGARTGDAGQGQLAVTLQATPALLPASESGNKSSTLASLPGGHALGQTSPPVQPAWVLGRLLPQLVQVVCSGEGAGSVAQSAGATAILHELLFQPHMLLPAAAPAAANLAARSLATWAKSACEMHVNTLADAWCHVMGMQQSTWHRITLCESVEEIQALLNPASTHDLSASLATTWCTWSDVGTLLCLCNHVPPQSPLYHLAMLAFMHLVTSSDPEAAKSTAPGAPSPVEQVQQAILGGISSSGGSSGGQPTPSSFSYVEPCRADMLRVCLMTPAHQPAPDGRPRFTMAMRVLKRLLPYMKEAVQSSNKQTQQSTGTGSISLPSSARKVLCKVACPAEPCSGPSTVQQQTSMFSARVASHVQTMAAQLLG